MTFLSSPPLKFCPLCKRMYVVSNGHKCKLEKVTPKKDPNIKQCYKCNKLYDVEIGHKCWTRIEQRCTPLHWYMLQYDAETRHKILEESKLTDRERSMVILSIGLDGQPPRTNDAILEILKVTERTAKHLKADSFRKVKIYIATNIMKVDVYAMDDEGEPDPR